MYYGKGIMNIQIENSIKDTPKVRNGIYLTTKSRKEGHGIGLQNVKLVVEKYHGQMEIVPTMSKDQSVVICLSGRGDKDVYQVARYRGVQLDEN